MSERDPASPPDKMVSVSSDSRVWLRRICSFSSSMRCSRSFNRTAYVAPSMPPPARAALLELDEEEVEEGPVAAPGGGGPAVAAEADIAALGVGAPADAAAAAEADAAAEGATFLLVLPPV